MILTKTRRCIDGLQREWDSYDPIIDPTDGSLACNKNGATLGSGQLSATVAAGSQVTAYWNPWPHTIGVGHIIAPPTLLAKSFNFKPVMVYMAKCPSTCASATPSSLSWVSDYSSRPLDLLVAHPFGHSLVQD